MKKILIISFMLTLSLHASNPIRAFGEWINNDVRTIPNSALIKAIENGYYNTANILLKAGIKPSTYQQRVLFETVLENAVEHPSYQQDYLNMIKLLLSYDFKPTKKCSIYALQTNNTAIIDLLINENNINEKLEEIPRTKFREKLKVFSATELAANPSLSILFDEDNQQHPLNAPLLRHLLEKYPSAIVPKLDLALYNSDDTTDVISILVDHGSNPEDDASSYPEPFGEENPYLKNNNALTLALALHKNKIVNYFLNLKKDGTPAVSLLRKHPREITPLHAAIRFNNFEGFNAVLAEANERNQLPNLLNATDSYGRTPLHTAACDGRVNFISALVALTNANHWYKEDNGNNIPIINAIENGHQEAANILGRAMDMPLPIEVKKVTNPTFLELYENQEGQRDKKECWHDH